MLFVDIFGLWSHTTGPIRSSAAGFVGFVADGAEVGVDGVALTGT